MGTGSDALVLGVVIALAGAVGAFLGRWIKQRRASTSRAVERSLD